MLKNITLSIILIIAIVITLSQFKKNSETGAPPYGEPEENAPDDPYAWIHNWQRPDVPPKVALQVGHWKNDEFPEELEKLRGNTGAQAQGITEVEVNLKIAEITKQYLEEKNLGIMVEILPATVSPKYWADVFIAIHADGSTSTNTSGFKVAKPWRDFTGSADRLVKIIEDNYGSATGLEIDPNVSRNMRGYYAFSWWRYDHAIHPMTTAVILETGFLTSAHDRQIIVSNPEISSQAIADSVVQYLKGQFLLKLN
jgi:N-acetylmuramoyl-L-alanine amidase